MKLIELKFRMYDKVKISTINKGYLPDWKTEFTNQVTYKIKGIFYES